MTTVSENIAQLRIHENLTPDPRIRHLFYLQSTLGNYKHPTPTEPTQIRFTYEVQANPKNRKASASQAQFVFLPPSLPTRLFTPSSREGESED